MYNREALPSDYTRVIEAEPDKLDIKRRDPGILFISYPLVHSLIANLDAGIDFPGC